MARNKSVKAHEKPEENVARDLTEKVDPDYGNCPSVLICRGLKYKTFTQMISLRNLLSMYLQNCFILVL